MQKAYLVFATISSLKDGSFHRSHWEDQISNEQKVHSELLQKIQLGERVEGVEQDPLKANVDDYSYEYNAIPGFL